jgi:hypothetical protein
MHRGTYFDEAKAESIGKEDLAFLLLILPMPEDFQFLELAGNLLHRQDIEIIS